MEEPDRGLLPEEMSAGRRKIWFGLMFVLSCLYLTGFVISLVSASAYKHGFYLIAFGICVVAVALLLIMYWFVDGRVEDAIGRMAMVQAVALLVVCVGVFMLYNVESPTQQCFDASDNNFAFATDLGAPYHCIKYVIF